MEGAGASNVSHAAQTRGMDSADEEPELPSAIQDLIRRLEDKGEPIRWLPKLSGPEFRDFFSDRARTITGWRSQVRLRILEAIGNCNTFEDLEVKSFCGEEISAFTASEWELILRGFRYSTVLRVINVDNLKWSSDAEVESLCSQLGRILNSSSVTHLTIDNCRLSARCFLNLASGLREHADSKLQSLDLYEAWEDSSAVKHVADMINCATRLETMSLGYKHDMEEETVGILSQALIQSSSLKELYLDNVKWGATLLLKALAGDDGNRSINRLWLKRMDRLGGCLRELLTSNPSLKEVTLDNLRMSPEEWRQLGEFIRGRATATTICVNCSLDENDTIDWKSIEALASAASSDVKDPTVKLRLSISWDHQLMLSMNLLGRVLRGEINSLKSFSLSTNEESLINQGFLRFNQETPESILWMNGKTGETSALKELKLYVGDMFFWKYGRKGGWMDLLCCLRGNTSLTHLDLSNNALDEKEFRDLMGLLQVNLTLQEIDVSNTSWTRDGKEALIQEALKQNQKRATYMTVFREAKLTFGDAKAGRLFLCGFPKAALGQTFQAQEFESSHKPMSHNLYTSKDGFVSESVFARLIDEFLEKQPSDQRGVDRELLENILINLDLCFKLEDTSQYFIPSFIPEPASMEKQKHREVEHVDSMAWETRGEVGL
ncbi:hypothetical protein AXG93_488s1120 [Marchantia polymorpha subsp. ruderalis]|uniref:Uncharacterized protein n=1 Tax=Marchantia polymorpha subsp. ruderalis TaxID=1480154 RepID=A0A176W4U8_MARPO|nr:hypothetical protein AXG93_488s1120 [Marchantia polymorpha subsp. ruderalis]